MRIEVRKILTLKSGTDIVGGRTRIKIVKNKVSPPFKTTEVDLLFGKGVSKESDVIDLGVQHGIISKTGSWYSYGEEKLGQGKNGVTKLMEETPALFEEVRAKILEKLGLKPIEEKTPEKKVKEKVE